MFIRSIFLISLIHSVKLLALCPAPVDNIYYPTNVPDLIQCINDFNAQFTDYTIDLSKGPPDGFILNALNFANDTTDGLNGLPSITNTQNILIIQNGTIKRDNPSPDLFRLFHVNLDTTLILFNVTLENGVSDISTSSSGLNGGAIYNKGDLTIQNSTISFSVAGDATNTGDGGALYNDINAITSIINSTLSKNTATNNGGAILSRGRLTISTNSKILTNVANNNGGGLGNFGVATINNSAISDNTVSNDGGGIFNATSSIITNINNSNISTNIAFDDAGGIYNNGLIDQISFSTFLENSAEQIGGAIYNDLPGVIANIENSTFSLNKVTNGNGINSGDGGGISNDGTINNIIDTTFSLNNSKLGGGISNFFGSINKIANTIFKENTSENFGGGISNQQIGNINIITNSTFSQNNAKNGGGIATFGAIEEILSSTFSNNHASNDGGGIFSNNGAIISKIINSTLAKNTASNLGGAIHNAALSTIKSLSNSTISENTANKGGGLSNLGIIDLVSTIVAKNIAKSGPDVYNDNGVLTENHNLIGNNSNSNIESGDPNENNSFVGTFDDPIDPKLGPLENNGGPTETMALLLKSLAIDHGSNPHALEFDQRGSPFLRESPLKKPDIGAYELNCIDEGCDKEKTPIIFEDCDDDQDVVDDVEAKIIPLPPPPPLLPLLPLPPSLKEVAAPLPLAPAPNIEPVEKAPKVILAPKEIVEEEEENILVEEKSGGCSSINTKAQSINNLTLLMTLFIFGILRRRAKNIC